MSDITEVGNFIKQTFLPNELGLLGGIIVNLDTINLGEQFRGYLSGTYENLDPELSQSDMKDALKLSIANYLVDEVVVPILGIIISKPRGLNLILLGGLINFYADLKIFNGSTTLDVYNTLMDNDLTSEHKLGVIVNQYRPDYNIFDAIEELESVPEQSITRYAKILENTISEAEAVDVGAFVTKINDIDPMLLNSNLITYVITNNAYDMTNTQALGYLIALTKTNELSPEALGLELLAMGVVIGNDLIYMVEVVNTIFEEYNTDIIVTYLNKYLTESVDD